MSTVYLMWLFFRKKKSRIKILNIASITFYSIKKNPKYVNNQVLDIVILTHFPLVTLSTLSLLSLINLRELWLHISILHTDHRTKPGWPSDRFWWRFHWGMEWWQRIKKNKKKQKNHTDSNVLLKPNFWNRVFNHIFKTWTHIPFSSSWEPTSGDDFICFS